MTFFVAQRLTLCALLAAACVSDMKTDRIPNRLCLAGCLSGLCLNAIFSGGSGVLFSFAGLLIPVVTLFLLFHFRVIGAGDIKLLSVCGAFLDLSVLPSFLLYTFCFGGLVSLFLIAGRGISPMERFSYLVSFLGQESRGERRPYRREGAFPENFCFSVPILLAGVYSVSAGLL